MPLDPLTLVFFLLAYLLGSVPFGLVLVWLAGKGDVRSIGSGNIGATNVLRTGSKVLALATLLLDAGKGVLALALLRLFTEPSLVVEAIVAGAAVFGHIFPIWLKFKGGKGVATALAVIGFLDWVLLGVAAASWLGVFVFTKMSALAAIVTFIVLPIAAFFVSANALFWLVLGLSVLVIVRHYENIKRILSKEELTFKS